MGHEIRRKFSIEKGTAADTRSKSFQARQSLMRQLRKFANDPPQVQQLQAATLAWVPKLR